MIIDFEKFIKCVHDTKKNYKYNLTYIKDSIDTHIYNNKKFVSDNVIKCILHNKIKHFRLTYDNIKINMFLPNCLKKK